MGEQFDYVVVGLGALGSAAAMELAVRGHTVLGVERFALGHDRGASHDTSRILRHSYHTPAYVRLTREAYADWDRLERRAGEGLVSVVGGLDLFPPGAAIPPGDYVGSLSEVGIEFETLDAEEVGARWPQLRLPEGTLALHQPDAAIVPAARGTATMQRIAREHGAELRGHSRVREVRAEDHVMVELAGRRVAAAGVVICADAWTDELLAPLGVHVPLSVTLEQVTYFAPPEPARFRPGRIPLWIWMDDPSYYAFPCYGEDTVKAAQDCGGPLVDPDDRSHEPDAEMERRLAEHLARICPDAGPPVRSLRCQYTLTPDRDFVMAPVPGVPAVVVGLGAAHGFKFAPTFGRVLADLVTEGTTTTDVSGFALDRPALTDASYEAHWLV